MCFIVEATEAGNPPNLWRTSLGWDQWAQKSTSLLNWRNGTDKALATGRGRAGQGQRKRGGGKAGSLGMLLQTEKLSDIIAK